MGQPKERKYPTPKADLVTVPWVPVIEGEPEWSDAFALLQAPYCRIDGDFYDLFASQGIQGNLSLALHWTYRKRWNPKHKISGKRPKRFVQAHEPLGDLFLVLLKLAEAEFELLYDGTSESANLLQYNHPAILFCAAVKDIQGIVLLSPTDKTGLISALRKKARDLGEAGDIGSNPFSSEATPNLWVLVEFAREICINFDREFPWFYRDLWRGTPSQKGLVYALKGWIAQLEKGHWKSTIRDEKQISLYRSGRGNRILRSPLPPP